MPLDHRRSRRRRFVHTPELLIRATGGALELDVAATVKAGVVMAAFALAHSVLTEIVWFAFLRGH